MKITTTETITPRERIVARAVYLAEGYFTDPDRENLTRQAREYYDADKNRSATDIAYLVIRYNQPRLPL